MSKAHPPDASKPQRIGELVAVRDHPTVVRLADLDSPEAAWITDSFLATPAIRDHLAALGQAIGRHREKGGQGAFLIGQYGSGKSHFLAYLAQNIARLAKAPPTVVSVSLLNYRSATPLEQIVAQATELGGDAEEGDRRVPWRRLPERYPQGLLLLLDELSEFLRSKPDAPSFNEDIRFLQFLGEWSRDHRLFIVAALQEQIEHTGELEYTLYRKIKDRFPLRLLLTPTHVEDLVADAILIKEPGYEEAVAALLADLERGLSELPLDREALARLYPLHPATLELLEEVRDRFSQARGVVDFTVGQLRGQPERGITPFLDETWGRLLTPDRIVDHFRDLFEIQPEFLALAQRLLPYYRDELPRLYPKPAQRELGERLLHLLILVHLSPARDTLRVEEAASWLLYRVSRLDPERNLKVIAGTLERLRSEGRYVVADGGGYRLELEDTSTALLDRLLEREREGLRGHGDSLFEELAELIEEDFNPFELPRDAWQPRQVRWHFHDRPFAVYFGQGEPPLAPEEARGTALVIRLPWGQAGCAAGSYTLVPSRLRSGDDLLELAALRRLRQRPLSPEAKRRLETRLRERLLLFHSQLEQAYRDAELFDLDAEEMIPPRQSVPLRLKPFLDQLAVAALERRYPAFERFAPTHGPLSRELYRRFLRAAFEQELGAAEVDDAVRMIREAYLVPMKLLRRDGRLYRLPLHLERNELVRLVLPLIEHHPSPRTVAEHLESPIYGLVRDQIALLLLVLLLAGEIDIVQSGRSLREVYESLPDPLQYDQLVPGTRLSAAELRELEALRAGLKLRAVKEWTAVAQRRAAAELRQQAQLQANELAAVRTRLSELGEGEELLLRIGSAIDSWQQLVQATGGELEVVRAFLASIRPVDRFLERHRSLALLPERLERQGVEVRRLRHLLGQPVFATAGGAALELKVEALGEPPSLTEESAIGEWIGRAKSLYQSYKQLYREAHDRYWQRVTESPACSFKPPRVASSRHLGLGRRLQELEETRRRVIELGCRGLVNLDFQPRCSCGFDGRRAPVAEPLERLERLEREIVETIDEFFSRDEIRERLTDWEKQELPGGEALAGYLAGRERHPADEVPIELLDRHLAGVDLVRELDPGRLLELLEERTWERGELVAAIDRHLASYGDARLRLRPRAPESDEVLLWCYEHALRHGVPLPRGLAGDTTGAELRPEWVGSRSLERLESLGLPEPAVAQILSWLIEGQIPFPEAADREARSPLLRCARELLAPSQPADAYSLAELARCLYLNHPQFDRVAPARWRSRLDALAAGTRFPEPRPLTSLLERRQELQWLVIDGLGLALVPAVIETLAELLPGWEIVERSAAAVEPPTRTEAWYRSLVERGLNHPFEKVEAVDRLLHQEPLPFDDLERLAIAGLRAELREIHRRLDPDRRLLLFSDHGFRLSPDGRRFSHGGDSLIERLVPVLELRRS